ncbi:MAG: 16S rRNA (cytosine(1402)-N(4))-methyltransferase RsmH [Candidatus Bostrichicola ureolyticus]|nr:MAG: 16S rRNA (cytosine(1402)-N(4))-methyltransferase RsmH [Candidatus Bostrichicola ureolyticus]
MNNYYHKPAFLNEIKNLITDPEGIYIDATFGSGGHSAMILNNIGINGSILAFDKDEEAIYNNIIKDKRLKLFHENFKYIKNELLYNNINYVSGIIVDLGMSSCQLDNPKRGFSIRFNNQLDMRMNCRSNISAKTIINNYSEQKLTNLFYEYGNIINAKKIAKKIVEKRKDKNIITTFELIDSIKSEIPKYKKNKFLAKLFQSIRIEVNNEIEELKYLLIQSLDILKIGCRIAIISYHSVEDRIVKSFFKSGTFDGIQNEDLFGNKKKPFKYITKILLPNKTEIKENSRIRSARLRMVEKL